MELTLAGGSRCRGGLAEAGADKLERKQRSAGEVVDDSLVSADSNRINVNVGGGLLCTLQERPDELEDG